MEGFREGFKYFIDNTGTHLGAESGETYVDNVNSAIDELVKDMNSFDGFHTDASKLQGDVAEFWHADTFNIDAAVKGSDNHAYVNRSHDFASPDVSTNFGDKYGLKYYRDGVASAKAQAKSVFERFKEYQAQGGKDSIDKFLDDRGYADIDSVLNDPIYTGQKRLIPRDQLVEATEWLKKKIAKESSTRPEQVKRYQDTLDFLEDRIRDNEGTESIPLSREESQKLAELAKQGKVEAEDLGLTTEELITYEYILQQSLKAGMTAATLSIVLKIAPEVLNAIKYLIENGELDEEQFKKIGFAALSGGAEGFIRGTVSAGLTAACKAGLLGTTAKAVNPSAIGMAIVIVMDTMKNAYKVVAGDMSHKELTDSLVKETFIASVSMIGGSLIQAIIPELPVVGFLIGSFAGSALGGLVYSASTNFCLSFCADTGFTMFGLVKQDYSLPDEVLEEIGIDVFQTTEFKIEEFELTKFELTEFRLTEFEVTRFMPYFLRRGVIGIREIGYI